ncbi:MAG TPA: hypothetical protein PKE00_05825 [Planctomycetota bacterium]|nr:hypothetical protein [Planctomycetota bacterium]
MRKSRHLLVLAGALVFVCAGFFLFHQSKSTANQEPSAPAGIELALSPDARAQLDALENNSQS